MDPHNKMHNPMVHGQKETVATDDLSINGFGFVGYAFDELVNQSIFEHFSSYPDFGCLILKDQKIFYANKFYYDILHYSGNDLHATSIQTIVHEDYTIILEEYLHAIVSGEHVTGGLHIPFLDKNGQQIWLDIRANSKIIEDEIFLILSSFNINNRKTAEKGMIKSEFKNRYLVEAIPDTIVVFDNKGFLVDIVNHNRVGSSAFSESSIGKDVECCLDKDAAKAINKSIKTCLKKKKPVFIEYKSQIINRDEYFEGRMVYYNRHHVLFVVRNVTLKRKAEDRLVESEMELKKLNQTKDQFLSIIAHDLKNPLNNIMGFCKLLMKNGDKYDREKISDILNMILHSTQSSFTLLENLLEWTRAQSGKIKLMPERIDLYDIIYENIKLFMSSAKNKNIHMDQQIEKATYIFADYNSISTVIRNLLSNALKFTPANGKITISSWFISNSTCKVSVADTGIGLTKKQIDKLFINDINSSTVGTGGEKGSGLGLILCKQFVEINGGAIEISSKPNEGSTFSFEVPVTEKAGAGF